MTDQLDRLKAALADRYKIERQLGVGGMATVYLAEDVKHDRKVAVKVLRPELAAVLGAERFLQEIKTTANLQHPHILPLFDSGEVDGFLYYVMPYIEGETLRGKLNRETHLSIDEAVRITTEVADALDSAHQQGVIHRDIKPENILLHKGRPMVADFGIALAVSAAAGGRITETGLSLGTPHYMSPEQATAEKDPTNRSDIYSLGSVLYEMLSGEPPHTGGSAQAIIMKIVTEPVQPVTKIRKSVPPNVAATVAKALEKLPADRFESAAKFAEALSNPAFSTPPVQSLDTRPSRSGRPANPILMILTIAFAAVALWSLLRDQGDATRPVTRFSVSVPEGHLMGFGWTPQLAISPDGRTLAYVSGGRLYLRRFDRHEADLVLDTEGALDPFFSPDGSWLAFRRASGADETIWRVPVEGGPATRMLDIGISQAAEGFSWGDDNRIAFGRSGIWAVPATGGEPRALTTPEGAETDAVHAWPQLLPDNLLLYTVLGPSLGWNDARIDLLDLKTNERTLVVEHGTFGRYVPTGHILYVQQDGTLLALPYDLRRRRATGQPEVVLADVRVGVDVGAASVAVASNGTLVYVRATEELHRLMWIDRNGQELRQLGAIRSMGGLTLSPDGRRAALEIRGPNNDDLYIIDTGTGDPERLTFQPAEDERPVWSPDATQIAYSAWVTGSQRHQYIKAIDSDEPPRVIHTDALNVDVTSWSADGRWLAIERPDPKTGLDIWFIDLKGSGGMEPFAVTSAAERNAQFSPSGKWLAYVTNENDGQDDVFVVRWPSRTGREQVSLGGGGNPRWAKDGTELFYWAETDGRSGLMVVPFSNAGRSAPPALLFEASVAWETFGIPISLLGYDVHPDGERFLLTLPNPAAAAREILVVENFFEELKAKVGN